MPKLLLIISLVLGLIGVIGKTTTENEKFPTNVKPLGCIVIALMFISFTITLFVQNQESLNRDIVAQTAYSELNRIERRGIKSEEQLLFVKRPFWY